MAHSMVSIFNKRLPNNKFSFVKTASSASLAPAGQNVMLLGICANKSYVKYDTRALT